MSSATLHFYKDLPAMRSFAEIGEIDAYHPVPGDWYVVITDVIGSTRAIEAGKYKQVNVAGGIAAMAIANVLEDMDYPFVFGGDGVTILIPGEVVDEVRDVLVDTRAMVREAFALELRVGLMPVHEIQDSGHAVSLAKLQISEYYNQAMIAGDGLDWAEARIKDRDPDNPYLVPEDHAPLRRADFRGFTCRWQDVKGPHDETVALIVKVVETDPIARRRIMQEVFGAISEHLGGEGDYHPLRAEHLKPTRDRAYLHNEVAVTSKQPKGGLRYQLGMVKLRLQMAIFRFAVRTGTHLPIRVNGNNIADLPRYNVLSSDFRKFDNTLKMILACTTEGRTRLVAHLERMRARGVIYYGVHISDRALTTCLLHERTIREVHFVDAADGGYALAAKQLKSQLRAA
ncbi:MAG: DUF3095 domain-containing protein [Myxococcales bacterium]|nr:DUF3095 domain-containing protein [Myxococcales bacterium]